MTPDRPGVETPPATELRHAQRRTSAGTILVAEAEAVAGKFLPVIDSIRSAGVAGLRAIAKALTEVAFRGRARRPVACVHANVIAATVQSPFQSISENDGPGASACF